MRAAVDAAQLAAWSTPFPTTPSFASFMPMVRSTGFMAKDERISLGKRGASAGKP